MYPEILAYEPFCATVRNPLSTPGINCFGTFVPTVWSTNSKIVFWCGGKGWNKFENYINDIKRILTSLHLGTHIPKAKPIHGSPNSNIYSHTIFHIFSHKQYIGSWNAGFCTLPQRGRMILKFIAHNLIYFYFYFQV